MARAVAAIQMSFCCPILLPRDSVQALISANVGKLVASNVVNHDIRIEQEEASRRVQEISASALATSSSVSSPGHLPNTAFNPDRGPCSLRNDR